MADSRDPLEPRPIEIEVEPTVARRLARWLERARILQARVDAARADHSSIDLGFSVVERDSSIGGGLLAGALAYRLFVLLLPSSLLLVSGLGLYAGSVGLFAPAAQQVVVQNVRELAKKAGRKLPD